MENLKKLGTTVLCLVLTLSAWALRFDPALERPATEGSTPSNRGRLTVDPILMERANRIGGNGRTPVAEWIVRYTFGEKLRPQEINAIGQRLITDVMEAPDRTNTIWRHEGSIFTQFESAKLGVGVQFQGGEFLTFTDRLSNSNHSKIGTSPLRDLVGVAQHHAAEVSSAEVFTYHAIRMETVMKSFDRVNQAFMLDGSGYLRIESSPSGMGLLFRTTPESVKMIQELGSAAPPRIGETMRFKEHLSLDVDGQWVSVDGTPSVGPRASAEDMAAFRQGASASRLEAAVPRPGLLDRMAETTRRLGEDVKEAVSGALRPSEKSHVPLLEYKNKPAGLLEYKPTPKYSREALQSLRSFSEDAEAVSNKFGLTMEEFYIMQPERAGTLSIKNRARMIAIRESVPRPTSETLMEKVIPQKDIQNYLSGKYSGIQGFISRAQDTMGVKNPLEVYQTIRLDYDPKPGYRPAFDPYLDRSIGVIRFKTQEVSKIKIPFNESMGGYESSPYPNTGNGFTAAENGRIIPEFRVFETQTVKPKNGAEIYQVFQDGREDLIAVYNERTEKFLSVTR